MYGSSSYWKQVPFSSLAYCFHMLGFGADLFDSQRRVFFLPTSLFVLVSQSVFLVCNYCLSCCVIKSIYRFVGFYNNYPWLMNGVGMQSVVDIRWRCLWLFMSWVLKLSLCFSPVGGSFCSHDTVNSMEDLLSFPRMLLVCVRDRKQGDLRQ